MAAIPFENLDVVLGRGIDLSDEAVDDKLIHRKRGGYCFEQNTLFMRVLLALGFDVTPISARVRIGRTREETPARTHVFLRVPIDGVHYLADVGVGGPASGWADVHAARLSACASALCCGDGTAAERACGAGTAGRCS